MCKIGCKKSFFFIVCSKDVNFLLLIRFVHLKKCFLFACNIGVDGAKSNICFHHGGCMAFTPIVRYVGGEIIVTTRDILVRVERNTNNLISLNASRQIVVCNFPRTDISIVLTEIKANNNVMKITELGL